MPLMLLSLKVAHFADTQGSIKVRQDYWGPFIAEQGNKNDTSPRLKGTSRLLRGSEAKSSQTKFLLLRLAKIITRSAERKATIVQWGWSFGTTLTLNYLCLWKKVQNKWSYFRFRHFFPCKVTCRPATPLWLFSPPWTHWPTSNCSLPYICRFSNLLTNVALSVHLLVNPFATFIFGIPDLLYLKALPLN